VRVEACFRSLALSLAIAGCVIEHPLGSDASDAGGGGAGGGATTTTTSTSSSASTSTATAATTSGAATAGSGGQAPAPSIDGDYRVVLTEDTNGCNFTDTTEGDTSEADVSIRQDGDDVSIVAKDFAAVGILLLLGTTEWNGVLLGDQLVAVAQGTLVTNQVDCSYTYLSLIDGVVDEEGVLHGTVAYRPKLPDEPACDAYACETTQTFVATRTAP